jgi:hypothetical protein
MNPKTQADLTFEEYISQHRLGTPQYEPPFIGASCSIDYRLLHNEQFLWFEVKEFSEDERLVKGEIHGAYDPHKSIRSKIQEAKRQFQDFQGECCSLVLFNDSINLVDICEPRIVLGSMLGDVALNIPFDPDTKEERPPTPVFTGGGRLKQNRNTKISAVIALERFKVGQHELEIKVEQIENAKQRSLGFEELREIAQSDREAYERRVLRTIVYENPHAVCPLPRDIFIGPFDERWGREGDQIKLVYTGVEIASLRAREQELDMDESPFVRHREREARWRREE